MELRAKAIDERISWKSFAYEVQCFLSDRVCPTYEWLDTRYFKLIANSLNREIGVFREVAASNCLMQIDYHYPESDECRAGQTFYIVFGAANGVFGGHANHFMSLIYLGELDPQDHMYHISQEARLKSTMLYPEVRILSDEELPASNGVESEVSELMSIDVVNLNKQFKAAATLHVFDRKNVNQEQILAFLDTMQGVKRTEFCEKKKLETSFVSAFDVVKTAGNEPETKDDYDFVVKAESSHVRVKMGEHWFYFTRVNTVDHVNPSRNIFFINDLFKHVPALFKRDLYGKHHSLLSYFHRHT